MIEIRYIKNKEPLTTECTDVIESLIGDYEKEKAARYRRWQDKQAYLLGKSLVAKFLQKYKYNLTLLKQIKYTPFNRPYIADQQFDFNISHSGDFVVCAFSENQVIGIDIEQIKPVDFNDFGYILSVPDKERIQNSSNKFNSFFKVWSTKEAILKADGCGLVDDLDKIEIYGDTSTIKGKKYFLKELNIDSTCASIIASSEPIKEVEIDEVFASDCWTISF